MADIKIFRRREKKYVITPDKKEVLLSIIGERLAPDPHGRSTISSLYLDTPDFRIIRRSLEREIYKEKLRIRSYGTVAEGGKVFFEIKKKYKGTVYKRRESMTCRQASEYLESGASPKNSQIMHEIDYLMDFYASPRPVMMVAYERDAYYALHEGNLRVTFDTDVRYRSEKLSLTENTCGKIITDSDTVIMEIKTDGAMPLWLARILSETETYGGRFSKYGRCYTDMISTEGEKNDGIYETVICR